VKQINDDPEMFCEGTVKTTISTKCKCSGREW